MKTENKEHQKHEVHQHEVHHKKLSSEIIAENISRFIINHGSIIMIALALIIISVTGVLIYNAVISGADSKTNVLLEEGISAYMQASGAKTQQEASSLIAVASERFRSVIKDAKSKELKLRATYQLASIVFDTENFREAGRLFKEVSDNRSFYLAEPALYNRAVSLMQLKEYDEAQKTLETFVKLYPKSYMSPSATLELANVYKTKNEDAKSLEILKEWLKNNKDENVYTKTFNDTIALMENKIY